MCNHIFYVDTHVWKPLNDFLLMTNLEGFLKGELLYRNIYGGKLIFSKEYLNNGQVLIVFRLYKQIYYRVSLSQLAKPFLLLMQQSFG